MRRSAALAALAALAVVSACSPHIHLDVLGQDRLEEIVLLPGPAKDKVLMIDVEGMISSMVGGGLLAREKNAVSRVFERLERAALDPAVKAVILRLETPGGEVAASDIIYHEILRFKERTGKPVVGLMMAVAASGGYYIASACDVIMAHPTTLTGSIGVISVFPSLEALMGKVGVKVDIIKSGAAKDSGSPFRDMSDEERALFQGIIDEYYEGFLTVVARNRGDRIPDDELRKMADGRVYTGRQALRLGLVDAVGYFEDAFGKALALASLESARLVTYTYYPKVKTNIYAGRLGDLSWADTEFLERTLAALKTGFYYLWLPQAE